MDEYGRFLTHHFRCVCGHLGMCVQSLPGSLLAFTLPHFKSLGTRLYQVVIAMQLQLDGISSAIPTLA